MTIPRLLLAFVALLGGSAHAALPTPAPADAVAAFYHWSIKSAASGAPDPDQQATMAPLVTAELHCMLTAAWQLMQAHRAAYPSDKPPYVEGDLYSSSFEGPAVFKILSVKLHGKERAAALVRLSDNDGNPPTYWRDRVHLRFEDGAWRVADFDRNAGFAFGSAGSLLKNLHVNLDAPDPATGYRGAGHCRSVRRPASPA